MKQGEKHRTALALASALTFTMLALSHSAAVATAQPAAAHEYELGDLPQPGGDNDVSASGAGSTDGGDGGSQMPAALADDPASQGGGSDGGSAGKAGSGGKDGAKDGGDAKEGGGTRAGGPAADAVIPAINTSASDDGAAPTLLIVLAALAAICTGFAAWRLRGANRFGGTGSGETGSG